MNTFVEVTFASGATRRHPLSQEPTILGRGRGAQIALPEATELEEEHLLLSAQPDGCWLSVVAGARTPALVAGHPFEKGMVPWGTSLSTGRVHLRVMSERAGAKKGAQKQQSSSMLLILLLFLPVVAWLFLGGQPEDAPVVTRAKPPALLGELAKCPDNAPPTTADEAAVAAAAKSERYVFELRDGVEAVALYGIAESCYQLAGEGRKAEEMRSEREELEKRLEEEYKTRVLGLERSLKEGAFTDAVHDARALLSLLGNRSDEYTNWLRSLEKQLTMKLSAGKKKQ